MHAMHSYSIRKVVDFLQQHGYTYEAANAPMGLCGVTHGIRVRINDAVTMSIQTHPTVAGWSAFAETALVDTGTGRCDDDELHWEPIDLFVHILVVSAKLNGVCAQR